MSAQVWLATAVFAASVLAGIAYLCWYGWREESYDFTAAEKPRPLPGALGASMSDEQERARREAAMVARLEAVFPPWDEDIEQWEQELGKADQ